MRTVIYLGDDFFDAGDGNVTLEATEEQKKRGIFSLKTQEDGGHATYVTLTTHDARRIAHALTAWADTFDQLIEEEQDVNP